MLKKLGAVAAFASLLLLGSCELNSPDYTADYLLPLVKTQVGVEDIDELGEQQYNFVVRMPDVNHIINPSFPIPAFSAQNVGPLPLEDDSDAFIRAKLDTAEFELTVVNNFPINIKAGTRVVISNEVNDTVVFQHTLTEAIPPNGGSTTFRISLTDTSPWIYNDLQISLEEFGSDGSNGQVVTFGPNSSIELIFRIDVVRINEIELEPGKNYVLHDTIEVEIGDDESTSNIDKGTLTLFLKNGFPADLYFEGIFLDQNYQVVDDQLASTIIATPELNPQGYVIESTITEDKVSMTHTRESMENLQARTRYMHIYSTFAVPSPPGVPIIRLKSKDNVALQFVGDVTVSVTP